MADSEVDGVTILSGDCVEVMAGLEAESVDAVVCDPPYGLEFMGKEWDRLGDVGQTSHAGIADEAGFKGFRLPSYNGSANSKCANCGKWKWDHEGRKCECASPEFANVKAHQARLMQDWHFAWATEAYRVLKPGGHLLAFGGTRTYHRLACGIEDAGFEIRDSIHWIYGSGFPKSLNVSKAIDRAAGELPPEAVAFTVAGRTDKNLPDPVTTGYEAPEPVTEGAKEWAGWGTALKPGHEPVVVARKPVVGTVAANVLQYGTGALNIDGCRIGTGEGVVTFDRAERLEAGGVYDLGTVTAQRDSDKGRWPANIILSHSEGCVEVGTRKVPTGIAIQRNRDGEVHNEILGARRTVATNDATYGEDGTESIPAYKCVPGCPVAEMDEQSGNRPGLKTQNYDSTSAEKSIFGVGSGSDHTPQAYNDDGGASRFFYQAKSSNEDRNYGITGYDSLCQSCSTVKPSQSLARDTEEGVTEDASDSNTMSSGSSTTARSPKGSKSTTRTRTSSTTESRTSNSSPPPNTSADTPLITESGADGGSGSAPSARSGNSPPTPATTSAKRDGFSTADADPATSTESSPTNRSAERKCADCGEVIQGVGVRRRRRNSHP